MDRYEKSLREKRSQHNRRNPSFSSTLLDAIYRSIDDECDNRDEELILYRETTRKKQSIGSYNFQEQQQQEMMSLRRSCRIEQWVEKKSNEKLRKTSDFEHGFRKSNRNNIFNSTSTSSDSSYGGFSSSEAESVYCTKSTVFKPPPPMQKKTHFSEIYISSSLQKDRQKTKQEGLLQSKSKINGELKKVKQKQPMSPGGRLANFLNSLFAAGNSKKNKISASPAIDDSSLKSKSTQTSTCSSASSYSRSCLSKKPGNGVKRSVRFYPVSVIVDEDCRPCGQKHLYKDDPNEKEVKFHEAAKDLLKGYQKKRDLLGQVMRDVHEDDDDDDAASYSSSDLFELENLTAIERYREELPVYETTYLNTNRAIANGLIL